MICTQNTKAVEVAKFLLVIKKYKRKKLTTDRLSKSQSE